MRHKNSPLKINKVKRYKIAKYPSYKDPNPIDHPETLPYPFKEKLLNALMAAGLAGSLAFMSDSMENPFPFEMTGLPYQAPSFGTGLPSRLSSEDTRRVIERAFEKEGVDLQENYQIDKDGVKLIANGYNEELNIGYVWMDWNNLKRGDGILTYSDRRYMETGKEQEQHFMLNLIAQRIAYPQSIIQEFNKAKDDWKKAYAEKFKPFYTEGQPLSVEDSLQFQNIYLEFRIENAVRHTKREEFATLGNQILTIQEEDKKLEQTLRFFDIKVILDFFRRDSKINEDVVFETLMEKVNQCPQEEWNKIASEWSTILHYYKQRTTSSEIKIKIEKSIDLPEADRNASWNEILEEYDFNTVSTKEVKGLEYYAEDLKEDFIAPISQFDDRLIYSGRRGKMDNRTKKKIEKAETRQEKNKIRRKYYQKVLDTDKKQKLSELESQVREYIRWAKSQQGY